MLDTFVRDLKQHNPVTTHEEQKAHATCSSTYFGGYLMVSLCVMNFSKDKGNASPAERLLIPYLVNLPNRLMGAVNCADYPDTLSVAFPDLVALCDTRDSPAPNKRSNSLQMSARKLPQSATDLEELKVLG